MKQISGYLLEKLIVAYLLYGTHLYRIYKNPQLDPVRNQLNPLSALSYCLLRFVLILSSHVRVDRQSAGMCIGDTVS
jgi:hypothetical protein